MASSHGKWETVVTKRKGPVSKSDVKKAKKTFIDNASSSKAEFKNPLEEGETIYEAAFKDKENADPGAKYPSFHQFDLPRIGGETQPNSPKKPQQKQKKQQKAQKLSPLHGIENRIRKIDGEVLAVIVKDVQEKFPTHSVVWLKEVASWLQNQFSGPAEKDLMLSSKPNGFPSSSLGSEVKKELVTLFKNCSENSIEMALCFCITKMIDELQKGRMTIGLRMMLQLLVNHSPKILITKMDEILEGKSMSQEVFLTVIWTYSQAITDIKTGLKVWWKVMFPVIRVSSHSQYVLNYIEEIVSKHEKMKFNDAIIDVEKFSDVLNIAFSSKSPLANSPGLKARFYALYPVFKRMYFSDKPQNVSKDRFNKLLKMLNTADERVQAEVVRLLIFLLSKDSKCFDTWLANIENTLKPSSVQWCYMLQNSDAVQKELMSGKQYRSKNILQEKAAHFLVELRHIKRKGKGSKVGFAECYKICNKFQDKSFVQPNGRFTVWKFTKSVIFIILALGFIDIYSTKGYKGSRTEAFAVANGIDKHIRSSLVQLEGMAGCVGKWSRENIPKHYAKISPYVDPIIESTWQYTVKFSKIAYDYSKPGLDFISKQTEKLFEKIDELLPGYAEKVRENTMHAWNILVPTIKHYLNNAAMFITTNTPIIVNHVSTVLNSTCTWVYQLHPTFFDKAVTHARCAVHCTQRYVNNAWQLLLDYTPIVIEASQEYLQLAMASLQHYCAKGHDWMQNAMRSYTGSTTTATA